MSDSQDLVGRTIAEKFDIVRLIGQGGMGTVFEARHKTLPRKFAIKILRRELANNPDFVERFRREAIASARIAHPNVIYITDFGRSDADLVYLVMEYLEGVGLDEVLSHNIRVPLNRALPILTQLADALNYAHQVDVVHRDLKPENILLTEVRGRKDVVKILDFGIAKVRTAEFADDTLTMQGQVFGTAEYMSPEQATGENTDGRSDIYALGCLAYEMITGNPPFLGPAVRVLQSHVNDPVSAPSTRVKDLAIPPSVDALVLRCLAKEPADRYQTGEELRQDLVKSRATLFSMGADLTRRRGTGAVSVVPRHAMTDGWQALGGKVPEIFSETGMVPMTRGRATANTSATAAASARSAEALHDDYHEALREVAIALVQGAVASPEMSEGLERLLVIEEEAASLTGTIALSEQNFDRIRFEFGQREKRLRYAVLDLSMGRAQLQGRAEAMPEHRQAIEQQISDLDFQIGELNRSCVAVSQQCAEQIQELDAEVKRYHQAKKDREAEAIELYQSLHARIEALRPTAQQAGLEAVYVKLDRVVGELESARG